jgi:hypothetical protein
VTFKPRIWFPIAVLLSVMDLVAVWPAAAAGEAMHATAHAALALAFGVWAFRLRLGTGSREADAEFDALELEANDLRQALAEAQERADFAERVLAQGEAERRKP